MIGFPFYVDKISSQVEAPEEKQYIQELVLQATGDNRCVPEVSVHSYSAPSFLKDFGRFVAKLKQTEIQVYIEESNINSVRRILLEHIGSYCGKKREKSYEELRLVKPVSLEDRDNGYCSWHGVKSVSNSSKKCIFGEWISFEDANKSIKEYTDFNELMANVEKNPEILKNSFENDTYGFPSEEVIVLGSIR